MRLQDFVQHLKLTTVDSALFVNIIIDVETLKYIYRDIYNKPNLSIFNVYQNTRILELHAKRLMGLNLATSCRMVGDDKSLKVVQIHEEFLYLLKQITHNSECHLILPTRVPVTGSPEESITHSLLEQHYKKSPLLARDMALQLALYANYFYGEKCLQDELLVENSAKLAPKFLRLITRYEPNSAFEGNILVLQVKLHLHYETQGIHATLTSIPRKEADPAPPYKS
jgi:hypothetical protein